MEKKKRKIESRKKEVWRVHQDRVDISRHNRRAKFLFRSGMSLVMGTEIRFKDYYYPESQREGDGK